jgi:hypothetical protein
MNQLNSMADIRVASVLSGLEEDRKIAAQTTKTLRVKIEKGHAWLCRFLPFPMGPRQRPWALLAQHWINGKPCYCKQHTSADFGGDPNHLCPICEVTDSMHSQAENDDDRDDFYQCQVRLAWMMYCLVIAKEDDRGRQEVMTDDEILSPYEFNIPKTAFGTFSAKLERSKARKGGDPNIGLLSLENGSDLWVARDKKNTYSFDLSDNGYTPIFEMDDAYEGKILRIWRQLKQPTPKFHDDARLDSIANMLAERLFKDAADELSDNQRRSRRGRDTDDDQPSTRGAGRSLSRTRQVDNEAGEQGEAPVRQAPARTVTRQAPPPPRQAPPPPRQAAPVRQAAAPVRQSRPVVAQATLDQAEGEQPPIDENDQIPGAEAPGAEAPVDEALPNGPEADPNDPQQEEAPQQEAPAPAPRQRVAPRPVAPPEDTGVDSAEAPVVRRQAGAAPRPVATTPPPAVAAARRTAPASVSAGAPTRVAPRQAPAPAAARQGGQIEDDPEEVPEEQRDPAPPPSQTAPAAPRPAASAALQGRLGSRIAAMKQNQG